MSEQTEKRIVFDATDILPTGNKYGLKEAEIKERTEGIPVYKITGEVLFTNLNVNPKAVLEYNKTASKKRKLPTNHAFSIMLSEDSTFKKQDKELRDSFVEYRNSIGEDDVEAYKTVFKTVSKKDILEEKYDEKFLGRVTTSFNVSNRPQNDKVEENIIDEETGEVYDRKTALYFRQQDLLTGEEINPVVFKTLKTGEREYTFVSPKTQKEENHYFSSGDLVNVYIRPFEAQNSKTGEYTLKYNPLEVEIVQTAFERGAGNRKPREVEEAPSVKGLNSVFGKVTKVNTPKAVASNTTKEVVTETPKTVKPKQVVTTEVDLSELDDFSDDNMDLG